MTIKIDVIICTYIKMRDAIAERAKKEKAWKKGIEEQMGKLEQFMLKQCDKLGTESFKSGGNTAFKTFKDSVAIEDKEAFKQHLATTILTTLQSHLYHSMDGNWQPDGEADLAEHVEKILDSGAFDLITLAANKINCKAFKDENEGQMPAGVTYRKETVMQIRKGTK